MRKEQRLALLPKKRDAFTAIRRFMCDDKTVKLKADEEGILNRWIFCDALLRAKEDSEESLVEKIVNQFGVSVFTARNDIQYTQRLFADARKLNKKYLIHLHLQRIDEDIQRMRKSLFEVVDKDGTKVQCTPSPKELASYAKLIETYTYTLNSIPEDLQVDKQPPPIFNFMLAPGQVIEKPLDYATALDKADALLMHEGKDGVFTIEENDEDDDE